MNECEVSSPPRLVCDCIEAAFETPGSYSNPFAKMFRLVLIGSG